MFAQILKTIGWENDEKHACFLSLKRHDINCITGEYLSLGNAEYSE